MTVIFTLGQMDEIKSEKASKLQFCKKKKVLEAISVLKQLNEHFLSDESKKQSLLEETIEMPVFLQVVLKKVPPKKSMKMIRVLLPHSLMTDTTEVCLFTGDTDKNNRKAEIEPDVLHFKELLKKHGISNVTEVIPLRQLRTEYKVYEARRQLSAAYDVFLSDKKIAQCLPKLLGKSFFDNRKFPIQINMKSSNLKQQIEKALSQTVFDITCRGNSCTSTVARLGMDDKEILQNILASVKTLAEKLPGEGSNISAIYVKTAKSLGIPIYMSFGNPNEVKLQKSFVPENVEEEELSTLPNSTVKVFKSGKIQVIKHCDSDEEDVKGLDEFKPIEVNKVKRDVDISNDVVIKSHSKKKKKKVSKNTMQVFESTEVKEQEIVIEKIEDIKQEESFSNRKLKKKAGKANTEIKKEDKIEDGVKKSDNKKRKLASINDEENLGVTLKMRATKKKNIKTHGRLDANTEVILTKINVKKDSSVKRKSNKKRN